MSCASFCYCLSSRNFSSATNKLSAHARRPSPSLRLATRENPASPSWQGQTPQDGAALLVNKLSTPLAAARGSAATGSSDSEHLEHLQHRLLPHVLAHLLRVLEQLHALPGLQLLVLLLEPLERVLDFLRSFHTCTHTHTGRGRRSAAVLGLSARKAVAEEPRWSMGALRV